MPSPNFCTTNTLRPCEEGRWRSSKHAPPKSFPLCIQAEVDRLEQLVHAEAARADYILDAAQDNIDAFAQTLDQQTQRHQRRHQSDLQRQRQVFARAGAQELVQERKQRMTTLIEVS